MADLVPVVCDHGPTPRDLAPGLRVPVGSVVTWPGCATATGAPRLHVAK